MKQNLHENEFSLQLKPVGCACNIKCDYCYVEPFRFQDGRQIFKVMPLDVLYTTLKSCLASNPNPTITWHGGEPTLAGLEFFQKAVEFINDLQQSGQSVRHVIQTNATLVDKTMAEFFANNNFEVSISLDGPKKIHGIHRKDFRSHNTFDRTIKGIEILKQAGINPAVICTVDQKTMPFAKKVFHFLVDTGFTDIKYSPVYDANKDEFNLTSELWFIYLKTVFYEWFEIADPNIHVRELDEVISWISNGNLNLCSSNRTCLAWVSIDPNGNLYPCEYLRQILPYGNIKTMELSEISNTDSFNKFRCDFLTLPEKCQTCQYHALCGNGCPATREKDGKLTTDGIYVYCQQRLSLFDLIRQEFEQVI